MTMLGPSAAMSTLWTQIRRLAPHVRAVLLTGAPDCGQQAVARLLRDFSTTPKRSFVQISAVDAEVHFAHPSRVTGLPADALLFIPDIDRFSLATAHNLLRIMRLRSSRLFTVVAATTQDLHALASAGRFPSDLAQALTSVRLEMPALKQRREDIPMLLGHLLSVRAPVFGSSHPTMTDGFLRAAMEHEWAGNLRELFSMANSLVEATAQTSELTAADFYRVAEIQHTHPTVETRAVRMVSLDTVTQEHISAVLRACRGNKLRAAEVLGISRSTLYRMLDAAAAPDMASAFPTEHVQTRTSGIARYGEACAS